MGGTPGSVSPAVRARHFAAQQARRPALARSVAERLWQARAAFLIESATAVCQVMNEAGYLADAQGVNDPHAWPPLGVRVRLRINTPGAPMPEADKFAEATFYLGDDGQVYGCWLPFAKHPAATTGKRNPALDHPIGDLESVEDHTFGHSVCAFLEWAIAGRGRGVRPPAAAK